MPEGPEIKFEYDLIKGVKHQLLQKIEVLSGRYIRHPLGKEFKELQKALPLRIADIGVKGKVIWWVLENGMGFIITHGMTGGWKIDGSNHREYSGRWFEEKHNRLKFVCDHTTLFFNDMRNFGTFHITTNLEQLHTYLEKLGPSVLDHPTEKEFWKRFFVAKYMNKPIGILLMEQNLVSGIGNYLRADILWKAKVNPYRTLEKLTEKEKHQIYKHALEHSMYHYKFMKKHKQIYPEGREETFLVYGKEKDPRGNPVTAEKMGARTIHWVKEVQV